MSPRVVVHIGLPKTATSYLQTIIWSNRDALRGAGVLVPGRERRDHLWSSRVVREDPKLARKPERHRTAWRRVRDELSTLGVSGGTGLVSHEFFAAASADQARRMVADLEDDLGAGTVEVVVTAREPLGLFTASWQESLKNGSTTPMAHYGAGESSDPLAIWDWRTLDLRLVLERWAAAVPAERTHVIVLDPSAHREDVWRRFADVLAIDPDCCDLSQSFPNSSMGVAQAEALRRVNGRLEGFDGAFDKGVYLRTYLADERLVPQQGEKFWPEPPQVEQCRERARRQVEHLRGSAYQVSGRMEDLAVPDQLEERRVPASVTEAEVADVVVRLSATMLGDVRELRTELARARRAADPARDQDAQDGATSSGAGVIGRLARRVRG